MGQGSGSALAGAELNGTRHNGAKAWTTEGLQRKIDELGPWFHNMRLGGVQTAPQHFLGNYPEVKFASFRVALPADLTGKTVLDYCPPTCKARAFWILAAMQAFTRSK